MNWLKTLTLGICSFSVIYTVIRMLSPQKFQQQMKTVMSLIFAVFLGSMILGFDVSDIVDSFNKMSSPNNITEEDKLVVLEIEARLSDFLRQELENAGVYAAKVDVKTNIDDNLCISISEARVVLERKDEIKSEAVRRIVAQKIGDIGVIIEFSEE